MKGYPADIYRAVIPSSAGNAREIAIGWCIVPGAL